MPYIQLVNEYLHSSGLVEFVWFIFSFLCLVVAIVRFFKLNIPIHGEDQDKQEIKQSVKDLTKESEIQKEKDSKEQSSKTDKDPKQEEQKAVNSQEIDKIDLQFAIDENDQGDQQANTNQQQLEKKEGVIATDKKQTEKKLEELKDDKKVESVPDKQKSDKNLQDYCLHIDEWIDKHLVSLTITVLLINSWGCYIYTAFITLICLILCTVFNRYNILGRLNDGQFKDMRGFGELLFHFWILTLFIAYFVYDQSYANNYTEYIA